MKYKWPILNLQQLQPQQAISKTTGKDILPTQETINIGITTIFFYFFMLFYIYITALGKPSELFNKLGSFYNINTLSTSLEKSEKNGTIIFIMLFLALLQGLFSSQGIYSNDPKRAPIIAFNYVIFLCWLLFLFIFPYKKIGNTQKTSIPHIFLAICVLLSLIINSFLISNVYSDYYEETSIMSLYGITYLLIGLSIAAIIIIFLGGITHFNPIYISLGVAYAELACLITFGIFLCVFIQFPALPNNKLDCVMV